MHPIVSDAFKLILDSILPIRCASCGQESRLAICETCLHKFVPASEQRCIVCSKSSPFGLTHAMCKTGHSPERLLAVFDYTDKRLANSIIAGKYKFIKDVFLVLGQAIAEKLAMELEMLNREQVLITPLPLHPRRKRWRGFNQSELLAQKLSEMFELPVIEALLRTRYTKTQKDLDKLARQKNIKGCFSINPKTNVTGKTVLLIDDVATTGSTLFGAATTLKKGGAQVVWCIALAQD